jgi:hypothetical protein
MSYNDRELESGVCRNQASAPSYRGRLVLSLSVFYIIRRSVLADLGPISLAGVITP